MNIRIIEKKEKWEGFLFECKEKTFLQSWNWGEFQKSLNEKIWRFGIFNNEELKSVFMVVLIKAKRGSFLFVPHGPVIKTQGESSKRQILELLLNELKKIAEEEKVDFIRISPIFERNEENVGIFKSLGFRDAAIHTHPELTWELNISLPEEDLLDNMRKTTKYLIRKAKKDNDIQIVKSRDKADIDKFNDIYKETAKRHDFIPFNIDYLRNEFSIFSKDEQAVLFLGKYRGQTISSALIIYWQGIGFYHQGASLSKHSKVPISYLQQWSAILEAKKRNCSIYNFWGIAPEDKKNHPWSGLSLFKKGFSGYKKLYVKTQDYPLTKKYYLTFIFEKIRKIRRGL